jgi:hypothetical protein
VPVGLISSDRSSSGPPVLAPGRVAMFHLDKLLEE